MAHAPLTVPQLTAQVKLLKVGDTFTLEWSELESDVKLTWKCVCSGKSADGTATFTSVDADDTEEQFDIPSFEEADDEAQEEEEDGTPKLAYHYFALTIAAKKVKRGMGESCKKSLFASSVVAWQPRTWAPFLNAGHNLLGREFLSTEIRRQLNFPERVQMNAFTQPYEHDRCALGEALLAMINLLASLQPDQQYTPEIHAVLTPILRRLCEHRVGDTATGAERSKRMDAVRAEFIKEDFRHDKISQVMAGFDITAKK